MKFAYPVKAASAVLLEMVTCELRRCVEIYARQMEDVLVCNQVTFY